MIGLWMWMACTGQQTAEKTEVTEPQTGQTQPLKTSTSTTVQSQNAKSSQKQQGMNGPKGKGIGPQHQHGPKRSTTQYEGWAGCQWFWRRVSRPIWVSAIS